MKQIFTFLLLFSFFQQLGAQAPQTLNYQGVARNAQGQPYANATIVVRLKMHDLTPTGTVLYSEQRNVTTNAFGLFNIIMNSPGASQTGSFTTIDWNKNAKFLEIEIDPNSTGTYTSIGTTQMQSVPYSLLSAKATKLVLPYSESMNTNSTMLSLVNTGAGYGIYTGNTGTGIGIYSAVSANTGISSLTESTNAQHSAVRGFAGLGSSSGIYGESGSSTGIGVRAVNNNSGLALSVEGKLKIAGGNTNPGTGKVLTSDAQGNATWQNAPSASTNKVGFSVRGAASNGLQNLAAAQWNKFHGGYEEYDPGNDYTLYNQGSAANPSSSFTVPVSGFYHLEAGIQMATNTFDEYFVSASIRFQLKRNGVTTTLFTDDSHSNKSPNDGIIYLPLSLNVPLVAGDQVWVEVRGFTTDGNYHLFASSDVNQTKSFSSFSGYLIFAN